ISGGEAADSTAADGPCLQPAHARARTVAAQDRAAMRRRAIGGLRDGASRVNAPLRRVRPVGRRPSVGYIVCVGLSAFRVPASRVSILPLTFSPSAVSANWTPMPAVRLPCAPGG